MKKLLSLFVLFLIINACDDGDITVQNITFEEVATSSNCSDIVYKINKNEVLLIKINNIHTTAFPNEVTLANTPRTIPITGSTQVIYRNYNGVPSASNFCTLPPAATPSVVEEWNAIGGNIEITTTAVKSDPDATTGATRILRYNHYIVFKNINFQKPSGTQLYDRFVFGNYQTANNLTFPYTSPQALSKCAGSPISIISNQIGNEGIVIKNLSPSLFVNTPTTSPRIANLSASGNNVLSFFVLSSTIPQNYFCTLPVPVSPSIIEEWQADIAATGGTIEVTTTVSSSIYTHKVRLKNVTFKKTVNPVSFYLGNDYYLGDVTTP